MDPILYRPAMWLAYRLAQSSPDPSTQNGAVLTDEDGFPHHATAACNAFPRKVKYLDKRWERPIKYAFVEHAERNAIYQAARNGVATDGMTMVCPWAACSDCARAIIQAGIKRLVTNAPDDSTTSPRWDDSIAVAMTMLEEAGVEVVPVVLKFPHVSPIRRNGELWQP